jgi:IS5 family transposase
MLMKLTIRCGPAAVDGLNEALLAKATEAKVLRTTKLRADTTVVPSNVSYPTDSGLLAKAFRRIAVTGMRIQAAGGATRTTVRDRSRAAGKRAHAIGFKLRSRSAAGCDEALAAVRRTTFGAGRPGRDRRHRCRTAADQRETRTPPGARQGHSPEGDGEHDGAAGRRRGRLARAIDDLEDLVTATRQITAQTRQRLAGQTPNGATRRVSLHDPDARPIAKGRLGKPVEFGHKVQLVEGDDGVIVDHNVERGNPADAPQLAPAVDRVRTRAGGPPRTVTADRGYGEKAVEDDLRDLGVRNVVIPRKGKPSAGRRAAEHRPAFRRTIKWRTGVEGRISALKRGYGWDRTRIDGTEGAQIWVGHGVLAHNLVKISTLAA